MRYRAAFPRFFFRLFQFNGGICIRTAVITGASRGIGKAIAFEFAKKGYVVALICRHKKDLVEAANDISASGECAIFESDVSDMQQVKETFQEIFRKFGSIDVLVNNAGINSRRALVPGNASWLEDAEKTMQDFDKELETNLKGTYLCSYVAAGYMMMRHSGCIINISSVKGHEATSSPGYGASKSGVMHLTKDFAKSLAQYGIRVNSIAPGFIDTGMTSELSPEKQETYKKMIPQQRFGSVEEIANVALFLASSNASYITGQTIDVNGGYLMR